MLGSDLGVALLPKVDGKVMHPMSSTFVLALPNYTQHAKIMQHLIKEFSEDLFKQQDNQRLVYEKTHSYYLFPEHIFKNLAKKLREIVWLCFNKWR